MVKVVVVVEVHLQVEVHVLVDVVPEALDTTTSFEGGVDFLLGALLAHLDHEVHNRHVGRRHPEGECR